jgi:hypothetical protein
MCRVFIKEIIMSAGTHNITIEQGGTFELTLSVDNPSGTDMNLTGYSFRGMLAKSYYDDSPVSFTASTLVAATGKFKLALSAAQCAALDHALTYVWDCEMESSTGVVTRLLQGSATISPEVTV